MTGLPAHIEADIGEHLNAIALHFKGEPKITLLVRADLPPELDGDVVMTNDELPAAIAGLQRRHDLDVQS